MRNLLTTFLAVWLSGLAVPVVAETEFLKPDEAFRITARAEGEGVKIHWDIADGYYLYKSKFKFNSETPGVKFGVIDYPSTEVRTDEFFGDVEIYRGAVSLDIPVANAEGRETLTLEVQSQGCADAGLCYPPQRQRLLLAMVSPDSPAAGTAAPVVLADPAEQPAPEAMPEPATEPPPAVDDADEALGALSDSLGLGGFDDDILPAEEAFRFSAEVENGDLLQLRWQIAEGTYLYSDKIALSLEGDGVALGDFRLPEPKIKHDSVTPEGEIGDVSVYLDSIDLEVPLVRSAAGATRVELTAQYQGCAERGICYPPQKTKVSLDLPGSTGATAQTAAPAVGAQDAGEIAAESATPAASASEPVAEQDRIASLLQHSGFWAVVGTFFLIGLGLSFTPCVFPMIPILSGIITGQGRHITAAKGFTLSLVYVLAMAATYTVAGVVAAQSGENLQAALQNPWALGIFAGIFVVLSLSMFGFYDLQLPSSWQSRLSEMSNRQQGGTLTGVAIMGLLSALIVGPCVAPPLAGALIYIGQTGDTLLGGTALFAMSMGMGAPLIAIGTSAGKLLPRAGAWMDTVKAVFGVVMLGVAIYLLERILPESVIMLLWGLLLIVSGIYLGALIHLPHDTTGWKKLWKGLGTALVVYGALMLVGAASGGKDTLQPLKGLAMAGGGAAETGHLAFQPIKTVADLEREVASASGAGKSVMLDFYADWCVYCKQMEKNTFPVAGVRQALTNTVKLQADVTDNDDEDKALLAHLGIPAPPAILFFGRDGEERRNYRLLGYMGPEEFAAHVTKAIQ